jgi:hypothetical protein
VVLISGRRLQFVSSCAINSALALYSGSQEATVLLSPPPPHAVLLVLYRPDSKGKVVPVLN